MVATSKTQAEALPSLTAVDLTRAAVDQQTALLADCKATLDRAAKARASWEQALPDAENAHATALRDGAEGPDTKLLAASDRAGGRLETVRKHLNEAVNTHSRAAADVTETETNLAAATRAHEAATLETKLKDESRLRVQRELGTRIATRMIEQLSDVLELHQLLAEDDALVRRGRALGATLTPADGIAAAGAFLERLLAEGAASPGSTRTRCVGRSRFPPPAGPTLTDCTRSSA